LSVSAFERIELVQLLTQTAYRTDKTDLHNQLNLFN